MNKGHKQTQIHIARISLNYEQKELVSKINSMVDLKYRISENTFSKIESGWKKTIHRPVAEALCKCLHLSESELTSKGIRIHG